MVRYAKWERGPFASYSPPLHTLFAVLRLKPDKMEKIDIVRRDPYWASALKVEITPDKVTALFDGLVDQAKIRIYSGGSGLEGRIGAAAVMYWQKEDGEVVLTSLQKFLGSEEEQTVYIGEQAGELMALELIWGEEEDTVESISLY